MYRYGGSRIADHEYTMFQFFVTFSSVIFGAQSAGTIFSFARKLLSSLIQYVLF
jgi:ATP-binding cassette subfamily B (MDR/TAP) protein 1